MGLAHREPPYTACRELATKADERDEKGGEESGSRNGLPSQQRSKSPAHGGASSEGRLRRRKDRVLTLVRLQPKFRPCLPDEAAARREPEGSRDGLGRAGLVVLVRGQDQHPFFASLVCWLEGSHGDTLGLARVNPQPPYPAARRSEPASYLLA
jgi:hypothetical protein